MSEAHIEIPPHSRSVEKLAPRPALQAPVSAPPDPDLARLIDHLNAYRGYYTGAIIAGGDASLRYLTLSMFIDEQGRNLAFGAREN